MIDPLEDQAAGLRRLFRRAPPTVVALYAAGRDHAAAAVRAAHRIAGNTHRVLILDEAADDASLRHVLGLPPGRDLLGVLGGQVSVGDVLQPVPGLLGRVPAAGAAFALPLLDEERRGQLVAALQTLHRHASFVLVHADVAQCAAPSPFVFAAPRRLVVAEASRIGATHAYRAIKQLAASGAGMLHVAVAGARDRREAEAFFAALDELVRRHVGASLGWLGEVERDDLAAGLVGDLGERLPRDVGGAFLRRLAASGRGHVALTNRGQG